MIIKIINHLSVVRSRVVADIGKREDVRDILFILKKIIQKFCPFQLFRFLYPCKTVTGKVGKNKFAEVEIVYKPRPSGVF